MRRACAAAAIVAAIGAAWLAHAAELTLSIDDVEAPSFSARGLKARLAGPAFRDLTLDIGRLNVGGRDFRNLKLTCADFTSGSGRVACTRGVLDSGGKIPVSFSYGTSKRDFTVELRPAADESWRATGTLAGSASVVSAKLDKVALARLAPLLPKSAPKLTAGRASGTFELRGGALNARLDLDGVGFSDPSGLHAGEKLGGRIEVDAASKGQAWTWSARLVWRTGDVFWQPLLLAAKGQRLNVSGTTAGSTTQVHAGKLELPDLGDVAFKGAWDHAAGAVRTGDASGLRLRMGPLYDQILKPLMQQTALADLRAEGELSVAVSSSGGAVDRVDAELHGVSFEDRAARRFGVFGATGRVPWRRNEASTGEITLKGAEVLKLPIGAVRVPLRMRGTRVDIDSVRVPIVDGALQLRGFAAAMTEQGWRWRFSGALEPIGMERLTQALGLPVMYGSISGVIPELRYRREVLNMDGALQMKVFDGSVAVSKLELSEPFGRAPRLNAEIDMKGLDLELLTRAFDFGTITGRLDASVRGLELSNWEPVRFDASLSSSAGTYPRKISQRAVQNISALGGAGAAAAIQRSLLRFFDQFGYERLGLSCRLANGVCEMDGVEKAPQGYVIVKGGGIPAISVIGYNRAVSWRELVERLKRITRENVKPIVK